MLVESVEKSVGRPDANEKHREKIVIFFHFRCSEYFQGFLIFEGVFIFCDH